MGSSEVGSVLSGLKFQWKRRCINSDFFANGALIQAKHGARLTTDEIREAALVNEQKKLLPAVVQMVMCIRVKYWVQSGLDRKGLDQKGTYMALAISFDSGLRPCNVTLRDGPGSEDHCIRA